MTTSNITKSLFQKSRQCVKYGYLYLNHPELATEGPNLEYLFKRGREIEQVAMKLFPDGVNVGDYDFKHNNYSEFVERTDYLIANNTSVIFQASFQHENLRCKADVLVLKDGVWELYEIKSGTKVTDEYVLDLAYQEHVIKSCYTNIKLKTSLIYLNKEYVREGDLDLKQLFITDDITSRVRQAQPLVKKYLMIVSDILKMNKIPDIGISTRCRTPYDCAFMKFCWRDIPTDGGTVFDIARLWDIKKFQLHENNVIRFDQIPAQVRLSDKQWQQISCHLNKSVLIDEKAIEDFLKDVKLPIFFMDFETIQFPIPPIKASPYEQIPFQFSVHRIDSYDSEGIHHSFLAEEDSDPRIPFIENLLRVLGDRGTIFAYNSKFEIMILRSIVKSSPKYKKRIENVIKRIKDLWLPFEQRYLYSYLQKGSTSLKKVLPAHTNLTHEGLAIADGNTASIMFEKLSDPKIPKKEKEKIRMDLNAYCSMDTYGLIKLFEVLRRITTQEKNEK